MAASGTATLSDAERKFVVEGVKMNMRCDGRGRLDYRHVTIECGMLPGANGSARVRVVNGSTDVIAAVKAEIGTPDAETPNRGKVVVSVECWTRLPPQFAGRNAADVNADLSNTLSRVLGTSGAVDLEALCVIPGKQCWVLYVDMLVFDTGGTLIDALTLTAYAALNNTRLPKLQVIKVGSEEAASGDADATVAGEASKKVEEDAEYDIEVDDDPEHALAIDASQVPVCVTFAHVGGRAIVDARQSEELCASSRMMVYVNRSGNVCAVETSGTGSVDTAVDAASVAKGLLARVDEALARESSKPTEDELFELSLKRLQQRDADPSGSDDEAMGFTEADLYRE